jgi:hypothetical protein
MVVDACGSIRAWQLCKTGDAWVKNIVIGKCVAGTVSFFAPDYEDRTGRTRGRSVSDAPDRLVGP